MSFFLLLSFFLISCESYQSGPLSAPAAYGEISPAKQRLVERAGSLSLKAISLTSVAQQTETRVKSHGGLVASASLTKNDYTAAIRVPSQSLEALMGALKSLGKVTHEKITMEDVTASYRDLEGELQNKRALRDRLRKLLGKSRNVTETLKIQKELSRVQGEVEQLERRRRGQKSRVVYSRLSFKVERARIPGPVGATTQGIGWFFRKLFRLN